MPRAVAQFRAERTRGVASQQDLYLVQTRITLLLDIANLQAVMTT
jgi:hypothetical protein